MVVWCWSEQSSVGKMRSVLMSGSGTIDRRNLRQCCFLRRRTCEVTVNSCTNERRTSYDSLNCPFGSEVQHPSMLFYTRNNSLASHFINHSTKRLVQQQIARHKSPAPPDLLRDHKP